MGRKIWAFVAFNAYAALLVSAFQENTAFLFETAQIEEMRLADISFDPRELGWGSHYIWRLFTSVVVTAVAGFLTGSIAKSKGALTAAIANIPSVLVWILMIYLFGFSDFQYEEKTAFLIISILAIPLTTYVAFIAGGFGEEYQEAEFDENTVLGIKPYHWIWAIVPIYWYARGIVFVAAKFIAFQVATWGETGIFISIISLLLLLPILAWGYPLLLVHRVLTGEMLADKNSFIRGISNFTIIILGMIIAIALQLAISWLLATIAGWL